MDRPDHPPLGYRVFFFFLWDSRPLPFLVSRHQHVGSVASDSDFVTPEPRRTARRHPNTQQLVKKKKPQIVFSSDESSEEGMAGPEGMQPGAGGGGEAGGASFVGTLLCRFSPPTPPTAVIFLPIQFGLYFCSVVWTCPICSLRSIVHHLCDSAFSHSSNSLQSFQQR